MTEKFFQISARIPETVHNKLLMLAKRDGDKPLSCEIRKALEIYVAVKKYWKTGICNDPRHH